MQLSAELDLIEQFVLRIETFSVFIFLQNYLGIVGVGIHAAIQWFLFRYHFIKLLDYEFLVDNFDTASHFARNRYNTSKSFAMFVLPIGVAVLTYSIFTRFNTAKFIEMFGTSKSFYFFAKTSKFKVRIKP